MDDLAARLGSILSSQEGQQQLAQLAAMLSGQPKEDEKSKGGFDLSNLAAMLSGGTEPKQEPKPQDGPPLGDLDVGMLLKMQSILGSMKADNKNVAFLHSLKPLLKEKNSGKVDDAIRMMQLLSALPALRESGILNGILGNI